MKRYLVNGKVGYGKFNDEKLLKCQLGSDKSGELYRDAECGMVAWEEFLDVGLLLGKWKRPRKESKMF